MEEASLGGTMQDDESGSTGFKHRHVESIRKLRP